MGSYWTKWYTCIPGYCCEKLIDSSSCYTRRFFPSKCEYWLKWLLFSVWFFYRNVSNWSGFLISFSWLLFIFFFWIKNIMLFVSVLLLFKNLWVTLCIHKVFKIGNIFTHFIKMLSSTQNWISMQKFYSFFFCVDNVFEILKNIFKQVLKEFFLFLISSWGNLIRKLYKTLTQYFQNFYLKSSLKYLSRFNLNFSLTIYSNICTRFVLFMTLIIFFW